MWPGECMIAVILLYGWKFCSAELKFEFHRLISQFRDEILSLPKVSSDSVD